MSEENQQPDRNAALTLFITCMATLAFGAMVIAIAGLPKDRKKSDEIVQECLTRNMDVVYLQYKIVCTDKKTGQMYMPKHPQ